MILSYFTGMRYLWITLMLLASASGNGNFYFADTEVIVSEKQLTQAVFGITRAGDSSGSAVLTCMILNSSAALDVDGISPTAIFGDGVNHSECIFTIQDDEIPEVNETFSIELSLSTPKTGTVISPSVAYLIILANDDAFGNIGFNETGPITVIESVQTTTTRIKLVRKAGLFGKVVVHWRFTSGPNIGTDDFEQTSGNIIFEAGQNMANLSLQVKPDNVSENDESFTVMLESPTGGAKIDQSSQEITVQISANDAPVWFPVQQYSVPENQSTVEIDVYRGLQLGGVSTIGPVNELATVEWYLVEGTAVPGQDYVDKNGALAFQPGQTKETIIVTLINDKIPEQTETFTVHLVNASQNGYISPPGMATVNLQPNDDHNGVISFSQHPTVLDEDGLNSGTFSVNRSAGTFGNVTVSWKISGPNKDLVFQQTSGILSFSPGDKLLSFQVSVNQNSVPEEAEEFYAQLYNVTGGARLDNSPQSQKAVFFVRDSDNVYGVIQFAGDDEQMLSMDSNPRVLHLNITRTGGTLGVVAVNLSVVYLLSGSNNPSNELELDYPRVVAITEGSTHTSVAVIVTNNGFINLGSTFRVELLAVNLLSGGTSLTNKVQPSSPRLGHRSAIFINITAKDANGEVGFSTAAQKVVVQEPLGPSSLFVVLPVRRSGTVNRVVVYWNITSTSPTFFPNDTGPVNGKVVFEQGLDVVNLTIEVKPDNTPEVAEVFTVNLMNASNLDRIQEGANKVEVTIEESDNPGGTFEFKNSTPVVLEEGSGFFFSIVRHGSALDTRWVSFRTEPPASSPGEDDFSGNKRDIKFLPEDEEKQFYIACTNDNLPEIDEKFILKLSNNGFGNQKGTLGIKTSINITVAKNDDPHGMFGFVTPNLIKIIDESKYHTQSANFEVKRDRGTFGEATVYWNVTSMSGEDPVLDITPVSGQLSFADGESRKLITIQSLPEMIPENNESFTVHLLNVSNNARLGNHQLREAVLLIVKNDDPVFFAEPTLVKVKEGHYANLTIQRGGDGHSVINVSYHTADGTAESLLGDYQPKTEQVTFESGVFQKSISIWVIDDNTPEGVEAFAVNLTNVTGDAVLYGETNATVMIYASDGGTGTFQFASNSLNKTTVESTPVDLSVERTPTQFGQVKVYWQLVRRWPNSSFSGLSPGQEFVTVTGFVRFSDGAPSQVITVTPSSDGIAELDEQFELRLINATGIQTGENGRIGDQSKAFLTVTANDYPYGLFKFVNRSVDIAEDFNPGMESTTVKSIPVLRDQGTWGTVKVAWEIETASESSIRSDNAYDLFLLGSRMPGVKSVPNQRRLNTETYVYCLNGSDNESFVETPGVSELESKFSLRVWVNASKGSSGYLLSSIAGSDVNFALKLNTTGYETVANFSYLADSIKVDFGSDIADGNWHFLVVTVDSVNKEARFYVDGDPVGSPWSLPSGSFTTGGAYRVGKLLNGDPQFSGCIQDIILYPDILVADLIKVMAEPNNEVKPINGYLTFDPGVQQRTIGIGTINDNKPEDKTRYTMVLYSPYGGARLDTAFSDFKLLLQVLKSDNANGLFGFKSVSPIIVPESTNITVTIERSKGTFGSATVTWAVYKESSSMEATEDFLMSSGSVLFVENENEKVLVVPVNDDVLPEEREHFTLKLVSVSPLDGSTPTSAASLQPGLTEVNITIDQSDHPYGLLQFMPSVPAVNATVLPSTTPFVIDVRESIKTLTLHVIRAQGTLGQVQCQWKTVAGTAKSPDDFAASTGAVQFPAGARNSTIQIVIADDDIAELNKSFEVQLFNPAGGVELNTAAKTAHVTILASDDAFGVIRFAPESLSRTAREGPGSSILLTIQRSEGLLGPATVYWAVYGAGASDLETTSGSVTLETGSNATRIVLRVTEDQNPELAESFVVNLENVSAGRLAASGIQSNVTILPSDDPYGVFVFSPSHLAVVETNMTINLTIKRLSGTRGVVRVNYSSSDRKITPNVRLASPYLDYKPIQGNVIFDEGQQNATVSVEVLDDREPEAAETLLLNLTSVELIGGHPVLPAPENSPRLGTSRVARVVIIKNDNASGIVQLSASKVSVHEPNAAGAVVNVTRTGGAFGAINVLFEVRPLSANASDYRILARNVTLQENQRIADIPVLIIHDTIPELEERFTIKLTGVEGGAVLGSTVECRVIILENDFPYGLIGFDNGSLSKTVHERDILNRENLRVIRRFGTKGGTRVDWEARLNGLLATNDVTPTQGFLVFAEGEVEKLIEFDVKPDTTPEIAEVIDFNLTSVRFQSEGLPSLDEDTRVAHVRIEANDKPHGVVEFNQTSYSVVEGSIAYLSVTRLFGTSGNIHVFYSTVEHIGGAQATPNVDYNATTNSSITIANGQDSGSILITIPDDLDPELAETFDVVLERVELDGASSAVPPELGVVQRVPVTIITSDDANGLVIIKAVNADAGSHGSRKTVAEVQGLSVHLTIERLKGTIGKITVGADVEQQTATINSDFIASSATFTFEDGDNSSQNYFFTIEDDNIPESDESIVIKLVDPTGGARVPAGVGSNVTVIIEANDGVAGQVAFDEQSRSVVVQEGYDAMLNVTRDQFAGNVRVYWQIEGSNSSMDFVNVNGTVMFDEGEAQTSIILRARNDLTPEVLEAFIVRLTNVTTLGIASSGQASLVLDKSTATVSISANDRPHGVVNLLESSRFVSRGDELNFTLTVARLYGDIGAIRIYYEAVTGNITALGPNQELASPGKDFIVGIRSIVIEHGISVGHIPVWIVDDNGPELDEVFLLNITGVELVNSSQFNDTIPPLLGSHHVSEITLLSNDNPYGIFKFPVERIYLNESGNPYNLTVLRNQGTFGVVQVNYFVLPLTASLSDFSIPDWNQGGEKTLTFADGQQEHNITMYVTDDNTPEGDETLTISLTRNSGGASLGTPARLEVVIRANDDAYGVFNLSPSSLSKTISEPGTGPVNVADFTVVRRVHSFGTVVVYWEVQNASASSDLIPVRGNLTFQDGDKEKTFQVRAVLDQTPEKSENFLINIKIPGNGRLTSPHEASLTISENESPYGELGIVSSASSRSSVDVEEDQGIVKAKVVRNKGNFGRITVDYMTHSELASAASGDVVYFEELQQLKTLNAYTWYTFRAHQDQYVLLAATNRTGPLPQGVDYAGLGEYFGSTLFRWQGVLVPLQAIATDGAVAWDSVAVGDQIYLAVANHGSEGRYETVSRVYNMNSAGQLMVLQNLSTQGAADIKFFQPPGQAHLYLIVANQIDNTNQTHIDSQVYKWNVDRFVPQNVGLDKTRSASALAIFENSGTLKVVISFYHDSVSDSFNTKSRVYEWQSDSFLLIQEIDTNGPVGVEHFEHRGQHYLVFANSRSSVEILRWTRGKFSSIQTLPTVNVRSAKPYILHGNVYLATVERSGKINIYMWTSSQFILQMNKTIANSLSVMPMITSDPVVGNRSLFAVAVSGKTRSPLLRPVNLSSQADFVPRRGQLTFEDGQDELELDFTILPDDTPERDESFTLRIYNASGKATVNPRKQQLTVNILSNDDAHGRIGFAADALTKVRYESERDSVVNYEVIREHGSLGRVVAVWNVSGNVSKPDVFPMHGEVVFEDGQSSSNISITVRKDAVPELMQVAYIRLVRLTETGSSSLDRSAVINTARATAVLIIPANDDPHGVVRWQDALVISQEEGPNNSTLIVTILRQFGLIGDILVSYETVKPLSVSNIDDRVAQLWVDYRPVSNTVEISSHENSTQITLDVTHSNTTEIKKIFFVNITAVTLKAGSTTSPMIMNSPRIDPLFRLLEIVIAQSNQTVGELNFNVTDSIDPRSNAIKVNEDAGRVNITVLRTGSTSGVVGFRFIARPMSSGVFASTSSSDFSPSEGTVMFHPRETSVVINISVINDPEPEVEEAFFVQISRPIGGVRIGADSRVDFVIVPNDFPYGLFGFKTSAQQNYPVQEGGSLHLEVQRLRGTFRDVHVNWKVTPNPGIVNASSQLIPMNGTLTFEQGVTSQFVTLHAVDDFVAERGQTFTCELVSVDNDGALNTATDRVTVFIPENDDAQGVVSVDVSTRIIVTGEPVPGYDGVFVVRLIRSVGQFGVATVTWQIDFQSPGEGPNPTNTFNVTSGTVIFPDGLTVASLFIKVKDDATAEELAVYTFSLLTASGTSIDPSVKARIASITVAASDDPFGIIQFQSPLIRNVSEDIGFVNLTVIRSGGSIGQLSVNYSVTSTTATQGMDYESLGSVLNFADKEDEKVISLLIKRDNTPELAETIIVKLLHVTLISGSSLNYSKVGGLSLNIPPRINKNNSEVYIVIEENDDPHGMIRFAQSTKLVREETGVVHLQVLREGGTLGDVDVSFTVQNGTAYFGEDFSLESGTIRFTTGQNSSSISVLIINDAIPEHRELFAVALDSVTGGAKLGSPTTVTVTIETSDDPAGLFGFVNRTALSLDNPNITTPIMFMVSRQGGAEGQVQIYWRLLQHSCGSCPLVDDFSGPTRGSLVFPDGFKEVKSFNIFVEPYRADEPEETFVLTIYNVSGNGSIDELQSKINITILKRGFPNGVFGFANTATKTYDEPATGQTRNIQFPVTRSQGTQGTVYVHWEVSSPIGSLGSRDLTATSGTLMFYPRDDIGKNIIIGIKGDDIPELEAVYVVKITSVDGGGDVEMSALNVTFKIRPNDDPHGVFKLLQGAQRLRVNGDLSREVQFTVRRDHGIFGAVEVFYQVRYSDWYPGQMKGNVIVPDTQREVPISVTLSSSAFLRLGSNFIIELTSLRYVGSEVTSLPPTLASSSTSEIVAVFENAANAVFKFTDSSTNLAVLNDDSVPSVTVVREGLFGNAVVNVVSGFPAGIFPQGFAAGQVDIISGSLLFTGATRNKTFSVKVHPMLVPNRQLVYAVYLDSATTSANVPGGANVTTGPSRIAVFEYSGVFVIAPNSQQLDVVEGGRVMCKALRQYSVLDTVEVLYSFAGQSGSFRMSQGEFQKEFELHVADSNSEPQMERILYMNLTKVSGNYSPRLGSNTSVMVTVKDNDDPHGLFSFRVTRLSVPENATSGQRRTVELEVQRTKGTIGEVSVLVRTVGGGEPWTPTLNSLKAAVNGKSGEKNATVGLDYVGLSKRVYFPNQYPIAPEGQVQKIQLEILDDNDPEPDELVLVYLSDVLGGARVAADSETPLQSWATVIIEGNDLMSGEIGFVPGSQDVSIDEDGSRTAVLRVGRTKATFGTVKVSWRVREVSLREELEQSEGTITFGSGVQEQDLIIRLRNDNEPERATMFFIDLVEIVGGSQARINSQYRFAKIRLLASDFPNGTIAFNENAIYTAVDKTSTQVELEVIREHGRDTDVTVFFETRDLVESVTSKPGVKTYQAFVGQDYERPSVVSVRFAPGETFKVITITLTPMEASATNYPKAFEVVLLNATSGARIIDKDNTSFVVISDNKETSAFLRLRALAIKTPLTDDTINMILSELKASVENPLDEDRLTLTIDTIEIILNDKKSRTSPNDRQLQDIAKRTLMDIFDALLNPERDDTRGQVQLSTTFKNFAFSLLYGLPCTDGQSASIQGTYAAVEGFRQTPDQLNGLLIKSRDDDYFQYPAELYSADSPAAAGGSSACRDVHFIDYQTSHWFDKPGQTPAMKSKVLSTSSSDSDTLISSTNPVTYRIYTNNKRVTPRGANCVFWDYSKSVWSREGCTVKNNKDNFAIKDSFVECQCDHLTNFAVQGESDDRAGYNIAFLIVCAVCAGVFALAVFIHHVCSLENMFAAKLLIHFFFSAMMAQLMFLLGAYWSRTLVNKLTQCSVLAIFIHYFFISQFSWMFVQAWNLWYILVRNDEHSDRKRILFFVSGWGLPAVVITLYVIISNAALGWEFTEAYADVYHNGDMCFVPNAFAVLANTVAPVLLFLLGVAVVFAQAYQVFPQWKYYDDVFRGHHNVWEVFWIIVLFIWLTLVWLFAGLHLAFGHQQLLITFIVMDALLSAYVVCWYCLFRNRCRRVFKQSFAVPAVAPPIYLHNDMFRDRPSSPGHSISSLKRQGIRSSPDDPSDWEDMDLGATPKGSRKMLVELNDTDSLEQVNYAYEDDYDTRDFDDLIFALKTGSQFEPTLGDEKDAGGHIDLGEENYEMKRISIADTHL